MSYTDPRLLDPDRMRNEKVINKAGESVAPKQHAKRYEDRQGNRELDFLVDAAPNLTPKQKEDQFAFPRDATGDLSDLRRDRTLPEEGEVRGLLSSRQRKDRSKTKNHVFDEMPDANYNELARLLTGRQGRVWGDVNDGLSANQGNVLELDNATQKRVRRIDRTIQAYERIGDRGHLVYCNVEMPEHINRSNIAGYARNQFEPGSLVEFDRYTGATHCLHEIEEAADPNASIAFEISTKRGMYLGSSDSKWNTAHLLPRGMQLYSHGSEKVTYTRPDGTTGTRIVVQLADTPPKGVKVITPIDKYIKAENTRQRRLIRAARKAAREAAAAAALAASEEKS